MATGTKTYTISKNVPPSDNVSSITGGGVLITADTTYSIPSGTTYSRVKVTKASTSSSLQFSWRNAQRYELSWNTWYSSSDVAKSKFVNPDSNKPQIYVKNKSSSYINTNFTITVEYTYPNRTITVNAGTGGTASASTSSAGYGDTVTLTATANTGYSFNKWTTTGGTLASATSASTTLTMPDANVTVTASFTKISRTITVNAGTGGTASANKATAGYGDSVTLTATPSSGYAFSKWTTTGGTLADATSATTTLTMPNANVTVTASFVAVTSHITIEQNPSGSGTISQSSGDYTIGSTISLTATASENYRFDRWICGNGSFSDPLATSTTYTVPSSNDTVNALFTPKSGIYVTPGRFDGTSYNPVIPYYYNGSEWVPCDVKRYNGTSFDDVITY